MYPPPGEPVIRPAAPIVPVAPAAAAAAAAPTPTASAAGGDLLSDPDVVTVKPDVPVSSPAVHPRVVAVEAAMLPYFTLPVDEQPLAHMTRGYVEIAELDDLTDGDRRLIESRLGELERNREMAIALRDDAAPLAPSPAPVAEGVPTGSLVDAATPAPPAPIAPTAPAPPAAPTRASAPKPTPTPAPTRVLPRTPAPPASAAALGPVGPGYDAVGVLTVSTVHTGKNQPELLRLLDPSGQRTIAYLEPNENLDTLMMMDQLVGIIGSSSYDPSLKLRLIRPDEIVVLGAVEPVNSALGDAETRDRRVADWARRGVRSQVPGVSLCPGTRLRRHAQRVVALTRQHLRNTCASQT